MDFFQSHQTVAAVAILLPFSGIQNDWLVHQKELDPNLPHANKSVTQVARILIYIDGLFSRTKLCQAVAIFTFLNVQLH
jgi:hypothetical protein